MELVTQAQAGTTESSDILVSIEPAEAGITVELESSVMKAFGEQIEAVIRETLANLGITAAAVSAQDKGALDCTVRARVIAACYRAADRAGSYDWEEIDAWNA